MLKKPHGGNAGKFHIPIVSITSGTCYVTKFVRFVISPFAGSRFFHERVFAHYVVLLGSQACR
jgi:hypothetical protein